MPKFSLQVQAQLSGISSISVPESEESNYPWHILLLCGSCGERSEKPVVVSASDEVEGIRGGNVGLKISCKLCKRVNDLTIIPGESCYTADDSPGWKNFLSLEARGTEPSEIALADDAPLSIKGMEGFEAEDAFILDGEYYGYDEKLGNEMVATEWKMRIVKSGKS
jgi:Eukaryotic protein of unknown function (DUF866)